jgi:hypothetical protein
MAMRHFRSQHFLLTLALLILASLAAVGVAYGQWVESLSINGTLSTGEVAVAWTASGCYDDEAYATISRAHVDANTIQVTINDGYPGYLGHCWFDFQVGGTIPVKIEAIEFTPGASLTNPSTTYNPSTSSFTALSDELQVVWSNGLCTSFDPGEGEGSNMHVTVLGGADESTSYSFTVQYTFEQANTSSCP